MDDIESALARLFAAFPNTAITEETLAAYTEALADIPPAELLVVVKQCLRECKFLPTIAELFERWRTLTQPAGLPVTDAWSMVQAEIRRIGSWGVPDFADPLVARVVRAMGWLTLCQSEDAMADRAHFLKLYGDLLARGEREQRLTPEARQLAERAGRLTHISAYLPKPVAEEN